MGRKRILITVVVVVLLVGISKVPLHHFLLIHVQQVVGVVLCILMQIGVLVV